MRKLYLIAGLYAACVIGAVLSGCSIYDKEDLSKMVTQSVRQTVRRMGKVMRKEKKNRETRRKMRRVTRTQTGRVRVRI